MAGTAIIFASSIGGHVRTTAENLAKVLDADIFDLKKQSDIELGGYTKVILGTGVHAGRPYSKMTTFINTHREDIDTRSPSLFICCMYKGEKGANQASKVGESYLISDVSFFPDSSEKDENGLSKEMRAFAERMKK